LKSESTTESAQPESCRLRDTAHRDYTVSPPDFARGAVSEAERGLQMVTSLRTASAVFDRRSI
jgi:hypothetical protein